jgi:hypothetical protein
MKKLVVLPVLLLLAACGESDGPRNYLKITGGGIKFNYRVSEATMVLMAQQTYPLPQGSKVEAQFDIPGKQTRQTVTWPAEEGRLTYGFESQPLQGITKDTPYKVTLLLVSADGKELDRKETTFSSDVDQSELPDKPLFVGPAYTEPHPENIK